MLKNKLKSLFVILIIAFLAISSCVYAEDEIEEEVNEEVEAVTSVEDEETTEQIEELEENYEYNMVKGDQYKVGQDITINEGIDGNVYIMGQNVTIDSHILGNVFICAENITIGENGYITNSLYAAANNIKIKGIVYDLYSVAENTTIEGYIYRDVHIATENINLYGAIGRDASIVAEKYSFGKDEDIRGKIYGDLDYSSQEEIEIPQNVVDGNIKFTKSEEFTYRPNYVLMAITSFVLIAVVWLILKWIAPKFEEKAVILLKEKALKTAGLGILGLLVIPVVSVLLMVMVIGAKAGLILLLTYVILAILAKVLFIIAFNRFIAKKYNLETNLKEFLLLIVVSLATLGFTYIPFVGAIFELIYLVMGFGIIVTNLVSKKEEA